MVLEFAIAYLGMIWLVGYGLVCALGGNWTLTWAERLGVSGVLGAAATGLALLAVSAAGFAPSRAVLAIIAGIAATALLAVALTRKLAPSRQANPPTENGHRLWLYLALLAICYGLLMVGKDALFDPLYELDGYAIWQLKAKVLELAPLKPKPAYFLDVTKAYSHLRYPLLWPMLSAGARRLGGNGDETLGKSPAALLFISAALLVWSAVRRYRGQVPAALATALFATTPQGLHFFGSGTAEMAITCLWMGAIFFLIRWRETGQMTFALAIALCCATLPMTKNEGLPMALITALAVALCNRNWWRNLRAAAISLLAIAIVTIPWLKWISTLPRLDEDYAAHLTLANVIDHLHILPAAILGAFDRASMTKDWGCFWYLLAVLLVLWSLQRNRHGKLVALIGLMLLLQLSACLLAMIVSPLPLSFLLESAVSRLLLQTSAPVAVMLGLLWPAGRQNRARTWGTGPKPIGL